MAPRKKSKDEPNFTLTRTTSAKVALKNLPAQKRPPVTARLQRLALEGCRAAGYALSGDHPWPHICSIHVGDLRIIVVFPSDNEVAVVSVAAHNDVSDPYRDIAYALNVPVSDAPRTKPACCDAATGVPPVDADLFDRLETAFKRLGN